ncbi:MAG TPA: SUF system Fe-S cluster assembly regulator [Alphaproteobacteria bacterium]|nr:SUF system Fe-S cluster assembly regulator [Alphaproteobacteria bacterium]
MIRVSRMADYGVVLLGQLAGAPERLHSAGEIAGAAQLPLPTVSKLLKQFAQAGLVQSHRGAKGGYSLSRSAQEISVAEIIGAVDGPISLADCLDGHEGVCDLEGFCPMRGPWGRVSEAIRGALEGVSLARMMSDRARTSGVWLFDRPTPPAA